MGPSRTGPNWVRAVIRSGDYTFRDMFDEPELMAHYVKMMMREGDERGYPVLRPQEKCRRVTIFTSAVPIGASAVPRPARTRKCRFSD